MKTERRRFALASMFAAFLLQIYVVPLPAATETSSGTVGPLGLAQSRMGQEVTVRVERNGNPRIALQAGQALVTSYQGSIAAVSDLEQNLARGLSLASADFDEDGIPDLVAGYETAAGGIVVLHRGNIDSIYPNSRDAKQRRIEGNFTDAPFLAPALLFELPVPAEFLVTGDFDNDRHKDVVAASSGDEALYLMRGDGKLGLNAPERISLSGKPTAIAVGEMNRMDTLDDLVVAVNGSSGPQVLILQGPSGALRPSKPEMFSMPANITGLALGLLDKDHYYDLAVATGNQLMIVHGRDQIDARNATISSIQLPFDAAGLVVGNFWLDKNHQREIAVLSVDGRIQMLRRIKSQDTWEAMNEIASPQAGSKMIKVKVSTHPTDDLAFFGGKSGQASLLGGERESSYIASLSVGGVTKTILPMRLTPHALNSLVILESSQSAPSIIKATPNTIFTVTNTNSDGPGSLRDAIKQANANPGMDEIQFQIASGPQSILLQKKLPKINDAVLIDATTQPGYAGQPIIEISGSSLSKGNGLKITGGLTTITGFVINGFPKAGILIKGIGGNTIDGNYIGSDITGTVAVGNQNGLFLKNSDSDVIGGVAPATGNEATPPGGNVISGNFGFGVKAKGVYNLTIQNDLIGFSATGLSPLPNQGPIAVLWDDWNNSSFTNNQVFALQTAVLAKNGSGTNIQNNSFDGGTTATDFTKVINAFLMGNSFFNQNIAVLLGKDNQEVQIINNTFDGVVQPISNPNTTALGTLSDVTQDSVKVTITGGEPNTSYIIEVDYTGGVDYMPQVYPITQVTAVTDDDGDETFTVTLTNVPPTGNLTHTSTEVNGNTSEYSTPVPIQGGGGNSSPEFSNLPGPQTFDENDNVDLTFNVTDPDGDTVTVTANNVPDGLQLTQFDITTFKISGILSYFSSGNYQIQLTATDNINPPVGASIDVTVNDVNGPPVWITVPDILFNEVGQSPTINVFAQDPDGDTMTLTAASLPPGYQFVQVDNNRLRLEGTLTTAGTYFVMLTAADPVNPPVTYTFTWVVTDPIGGTFPVINTDDSGPGSYRQAHFDAINSGVNSSTPSLNTIVFNIPGPGPHTISLLSPLEPTVAPIIIDGSTQPGFAGDPVIFIDGSNAGAGFAFLLQAPGSTIKSLGIHGFQFGIALGNAGTGGNHVIQDNWIGINAAGAPDGMNAAAISGGFEATGCMILNNRIENSFSGIELVGVNSATPTVIQGNDILNNTFEGLYIDNSSNIQIGGSAPDQGNVIGQNQDGVRFLQSNNIQFQFNFVGTDRNDVLDLGNLNSGLIAAFTSNNIAVSNSTFAFNSKGLVNTSGTTPGITIFGGSFHDNSDLGIDLGNDGVTANDPGDPDTGANGLQNYPVLSGVTTTSVDVSLNSTPNTTFTLEFFSSDAADPTGFGEGQRSLGTIMVTTDGSGNANFTFNFPAPEPSGNSITATATGPEGTSEFSQGIFIP